MESVLSYLEKKNYNIQLNGIILNAKKMIIPLPFSYTMKFITLEVFRIVCNYNKRINGLQKCYTLYQNNE